MPLHDPQLRVDEARNAQDVRAYLASVATRFVEAEVTPAEIEANVKNQFGIDLNMRELEEAMRLSKMTYDAAMEGVAAEPCYDELLAWMDHRDESLRQPETDFETLYFKDAPVAREAMLAAVASAWEPLKPGSAMQRPVRGTALPWVQHAVDPGVKGEPRSREKLKLDYAGDAGQLKDLARITFVFDSCAGLLRGLQALDAVPGWEVKQTKNKWKYPTPMVRETVATATTADATTSPPLLLRLFACWLLARGRATATSTRASRLRCRAARSTLWRCS